MRHLFLPALLAVFGPALARPAILPETIGTWQRGEPAPAPIPDQKVWAEYGLQDSETAPYTGGGPKYSITAYRFSDATGAMAAYDQIRPADARPAQLMGMAVQTENDEFVAAGNFLFVFKGYKVKPEELSHIVATVPNYAHSPLPSLPRFVPSGSVANSERYIVGPESLARFAPSIPPSTAGFHFSAEGEVATYGAPDKQSTLVVFYYPSMEMARDRFPLFQQIPGALVKRAGPLVAAVLKSPSPDDAERLLAQVKYQAAVTVPERPPSARDNPGNLFWNIFILCLVLAGFCVASGVVVGGLRILLRRAGGGNEGDAMISLRISGRP